MNEADLNSSKLKCQIVSSLSDSQNISHDPKNVKSYTKILKVKTQFMAGFEKIFIFDWTKCTSFRKEQPCFRGFMDLIP